MKIVVISKEGCPRCTNLKNYLKIMKVPFDEWDLNSEQVKTTLLKDSNFMQNFCEEDGCTVHTPVIYDTDEKKYYSRELFGTSGLRKKFVDRWLPQKI